MSSVSQSARLLELQALNVLQKLELQKLNKAVDRRNKRIRVLQRVLAEMRFQASCAEVLEEGAEEEGVGVFLNLGHVN